jgi:uncharacterized protein YciI
VIVVRMVPGSRWNTTVGSRDQQFWSEHAAFMDGLFDRGSIELAGPFSDGSGALVIVRSDSADDVRAEFATDPWSVHDVLPVHDVSEWTIFLDGRRNPPA